MSEKTAQLVHLGSFVGTLAEMFPNEVKIEGEEALQSNPDAFWKWVASKNEQLVQKDPEKAYKMAIAYLLFEGDENTSPDFAKWYKSCGLTLLTNPKLNERLTTEINNSGDGKVLNAILELATYDTGKFPDTELWNNHPEFYNRMAAVAVLLGLKGTPEGTHAHTAYLLGEEIKRDYVFMHQAIAVGRTSSDVVSLIEQNIYPEVFNPVEGKKFDINTQPEKGTEITVRSGKVAKKFVVPFSPEELAVLEYATTIITDSDAEKGSTALRDFIADHRLPSGGSLRDRNAAFGEIRATAAFIDDQLAKVSIRTEGVVEKLTLMKKILEPFLP